MIPSSIAYFCLFFQRMSCIMYGLSYNTYIILTILTLSAIKFRCGALAINWFQKMLKMSYLGNTSQGFFWVSSGAEIRPLSQWDLGDFFPN